MMEVDTDDWEEEMILLVELKGLPNAEEPIPTCRDTCAILGMDTPEPMLQFDQYLFKGSYEDIIGTNMIFEHRRGKKLDYVCKTNKKLCMSRVLLKNKESTNRDTQQSEEEESKATDLPVESVNEATTELMHADAPNHAEGEVSTTQPLANSEVMDTS